MDQSLSWYNMPVKMQLANVGSEVNRALNWKKEAMNNAPSVFATKQ